MVGIMVLQVQAKVQVAVVAGGGIEPSPQGQYRAIVEGKSRVIHGSSSLSMVREMDVSSCQAFSALAVFSLLLRC